MLSSSQVRAQINAKSNSEIELALISYYNTYGGEIYRLPSFKEKAFIYGFAIGINKTGKVDTVIFSNQTKKLDSLVSFKTIRQQLTKVSGFDQFKNTIIVGLVLIRREQDSAITNFYDPYTRSKHDEKQDFDQYFLGITPDIPDHMKNRKLILLPSFGLVQVKPKY